MIGFLNPLSVGRQVEAPTRSRGVATVEAGQPKARDCRRLAARHRLVTHAPVCRLAMAANCELHTEAGPLKMSV